MKCQNCGRNEANVFYTQNINGRKSKIHLCSECAEELNIMNNFSNDFDFGFDRMFSSCKNALKKRTMKELLK